MINYLELADWRRAMADLFAELRRRPSNADTLAWFRAAKDTLFREHPQSPLREESHHGFAGLDYWPFAPWARVAANYIPAETATASLLTTEGSRLTRIGHLDFTYQEAACRLSVWWVEGYGGGLFVPFRDATSGTETYGGGRYLIDSIKSADFGADLGDGTVTLDFNYAYHPSCAYDPRWVCPLAPPENQLALAIRAGERLRRLS